MTKEELREKRNLAIENLNYAIAILGSDELCIDELEKENAELKEQNTNLQEMLKTERSVTCKEEYLKKVTELEQENAELKSGCGMCYRKDRENLTKAKEIIKKLKALYLYPVVTKDDVKRQDEILSEVEQFIKDSEVEK